MWSFVVHRMHFKAGNEKLFQFVQDLLKIILILFYGWYWNCKKQLIVSAVYIVCRFFYSNFKINSICLLPRIVNYIMDMKSTKYFCMVEVPLAEFVPFHSTIYSKNELIFFFLVLSRYQQKLKYKEHFLRSYLLGIYPIYTQKVNIQKYFISISCLVILKKKFAYKG